jgi:hypothetical protein
MKQCPQCRTTYTDDTLKFCLADGAVLESIDEPETAARRGMRVDIEPPLTAHTTSPIQQQRPGGGTVFKIVIAVLVLGFLALVVIAGAGVLFYMNSGGRQTVAQTTPTNTPTPRPTASASPTSDPDQERLEKELANVLKQLEDELKSGVNTSAPPPTKDGATDGRPTARVNSPNDGFLALRDEPNAETGQRIAKIPHGAVVNLENCEKQTTTIAGRKGRWCMVTYEEETGWVFDAWLQYQ